MGAVGSRLELLGAAGDRGYRGEQLKAAAGRGRREPPRATRRERAPLSGPGSAAAAGSPPPGPGAARSSGGELLGSHRRGLKVKQCTVLHTRLPVARMRWLHKRRTKLIFGMPFDQRLPDGEHKRLRNFVRDTISASRWVCRNWCKDFYSF